MSIFKQMQNFLDEEAKNIGLNILKFATWHTENNNVNLEIVIENIDYSITGLEECSQINKLALLWLKNENLLSKTNVSVSVPGIDRQLFSIKDFERFQGEKVKIELNQLVNKRKRIKGFIKSVKCDVITLETDEGNLEIAANLIEKANIVPDWEKIMKRTRIKK